MKIDLTDLNNGSVFVGDKLNIRSKFSFEENTSILWSGLRLITNPPCVRELQINKSEIFSKGDFEAGEYVRDRSILIQQNVVPTIEARNLKYYVQMILRKTNPIDPDDDLIIKKNHDIKIDVKEIQALKKLSQNPISFSISGLSINLSKDVFRPGETIKINYTSKDLKELEVRLLQSANLVCYCESYGNNCRKVEELPPAIAGDVKMSKTDQGFALIKVPDIAEPSHNFLWEPTEKEHWGLRYGDYTKWSILVLGKQKIARDIVKIEVPIMIVAKPLSEKKQEIELFGKGGDTEQKSIFDVSSKFQKTYKIVSIDSDLENLEKFKVKIKNTSNEELKGVTVKLTGLQEGLFESQPILKGFNSWKKDTEKEIIFETKQNLSAIISILEDNSGKTIRLQNPIASNFF